MRFQGTEVQALTVVLRDQHAGLGALGAPFFTCPLTLGLHGFLSLLLPEIPGFL